jgi:enoyl-CoA hydratase
LPSLKWSIRERGRDADEPEHSGPPQQGELELSGRILIQRSGAAATVVLSNTSKRNAITVQMWTDLKVCLEGLSKERDLRCVIIRGDGDSAFSSGADISEFEIYRSTYEQVVRFHEEYVNGCLTAIAESRVPVVAAIQGACFGGGLEIAAACDIRIADAGARFGAPVGRLGFPLAFAETQGLFRLVGPATTAELLIEGCTYEAEVAYKKGLVTRVVPSEQFEAAIQETVKNIAQCGELATRAHKRQIRRLMLDTSPVSIDERMRDYAFADTDEYRQGAQRFLGRADQAPQDGS